MRKKFNLQRYKELLQIEETGKYSLFDPIFRELLDYQTSVSFQIFYNQKENYFSLIEKYLSGIIGVQEFMSTFLKMKDKDDNIAMRIENDFQELEALRLSDDLERFSDFFMNISDLCTYYFEPDFKRLSDDEFYNLVNNWYIQFQNPAYENLIYRSFKILTLILGLEILLILS